MIIDAHPHVWSQDIAAYPWNPIGGYVPDKSASIEEFIQQMDACNVEKAVVVQPTPYGWDNSYLLDVCQGKKDQFKAIVLVDPTSKKSSDDLRKLTDMGADGLRINLHLLPIEFVSSGTFNFLLDTAESVNIPVCFQLTPQYFDQAEKIFARYEQTQFILDHMGRLSAGSKPDDLVFTRFLSLSKFPNVFVKLSGLNYFSEKSNPFTDTWPLLRAACDRFSPEHCMWGSDFPFVNEHWSYQSNLETMQKNVGFSEKELSWILGKTADSIWWRK